jgi:hypothetical protein
MEISGLAKVWVSRVRFEFSWSSGPFTEIKDF